MDALLGQDLLAPTTLKQINCCRLFLRVTQLSDISTLAGNQIEHNAWLPMPSKDNHWLIQP